MRARSCWLVPTYSSKMFKYNKEANCLYANYDDLIGKPPIMPIQMITSWLKGFNIRSEKTGTISEFVIDNEDPEAYYLMSTGDHDNLSLLDMVVIVYKPGYGD